MKNWMKPWVLGSTLALAACNGPEVPLRDFVENSMKLDNVDSSTLSGTVTFERTEYYTQMEEVCERYQCGVTSRTVCSSHQVCGLSLMSEDADEGTTTEYATLDEALAANPGATVLPPVDSSAGADVLVDSLVGRGGPGGGHKPPPRPVPPPRPQPVHCHTVRTCQTYTSPRYCERNCRVEPVTHSRTIDVPSSVKVTVTGIDDASDLDLALGIRTNDRFQQAIADPSTRPDDSAYLFDGLTKDAKTLLVLKSKHYVLAPNQSFLALPQDFKRGDLIQLNVQLQRMDNPNGFSAVGTTVDLPDLNYTQ